MKTFDANDCYIEQRCTCEEIDTTWEPRWGISDLRAGTCKPNMVGTPKPVQIDADVPTDEELKEVPPEFVYEYELADYHSNRQAYRAKGGNVLALLKIGEERKAARMQQGALLANLTATKLKAMTAHERMLKVVHPILLESEDVQGRILKAWGVTDDDITDMLKDGFLDKEGHV